MNPYQVLEIKAPCNDEDVRKAYLEKVRIFTPDKFPNEFKLITEASNFLKTEEQRARFFLNISNLPHSSLMDILVDHVKSDNSRKPPSQEDFKNLIEESSFL